LPRLAGGPRISAADGRVTQRALTKSNSRFALLDVASGLSEIITCLGSLIYLMTIHHPFSLTISHAARILLLKSSLGIEGVAMQMTIRTSLYPIAFSGFLCLATI